jgi:hypothetical protein
MSKLPAIATALGLFYAFVLPACAAIGEDWTEYHNERFDLNLLYPADVFTPDRAAEAGDGQLFQSKIGEGRLLVGALVNDAGFSPASYQTYIARKSYSQYQVDYKPLGQNWFVLSGEGNGKIFYEKVVFSCGGRLINSFALLYSTDDRLAFDRIVERMEKSFRPGQNCDQAGLRSQLTPHANRTVGGHSRAYQRSALADRIARARGHDVLVVLRRSGWPYDYKIVRGSAARSASRSSE